jgi:hypothetical protein
MSSTNVIVMSAPFGSHPTDEVMERYSLGRLSQAKAALLEEHILVCGVCQERLREIDEFVLAMHKALTENEKTSRAGAEQQIPLFSRLLQLPKPAWAGAFATVALVVLLFSWPQRSGSPYELRLLSLRGADAAVMATAPTGRPLILEIDLTGLPPNSACQVEIADSLGRGVWQSASQPAEGSITVSVDRTLKPGQYWVRIYEPAAASGARGELLREFGLRVQ